LQSFQKSKDAKSQTAWERFFWPQGDQFPWLELVNVIQENKNLPPATVAIEFWKMMLGETAQQAENGDFLRGFVEGAVDRWAKVQKQL
jgi:hypothetical protein